MPAGPDPDPTGPSHPTSPAIVIEGLPLDERYRALVERYPHAVFGLNLAGQFVEVNPAATKISGYDTSQLVGMHFSELIDVPDRARAQEAFNRATDGHPQLLELTVRRADGEIVDLSVTAIPWIVADVVQGVYSVAEDNRVAGDLEVTRRLAVAALKAKSDFVARMSHEMRSPLTSILATAELLADTSSDADHELLATLQRSSQRLLSMIDDVLDFTAIGDRTMPLKEFDLVQVVRNVVAQLEPDAQAKGLSLRVHIDDDVPQRVRDHPKWTAQILHAVLDNAVKYTDAGHVELTVTTTTSANAETHLLYRISDTGVGIDHASRDLIFEPFTAGTGASQKPGRAAGLSIVKQLVTISGGGIALDSAPGRGTTFWITMPAEPVEPPGQPGPDQPATDETARRHT